MSLLLVCVIAELTSYSVDIVYLGRTTCWQPAEGKVPEPPSEAMNAYAADEDEED